MVHHTKQLCRHLAILAAALLVGAGCSATHPSSTASKKKACDCPTFKTKRFGEPRKHY